MKDHFYGYQITGHLIYETFYPMKQKVATSTPSTAVCSDPNLLAIMSNWPFVISCYRLVRK